MRPSGSTAWNASCSPLLYRNELQHRKRLRRSALPMLCRQMSVPSSVEPTSDAAVQTLQIGASSTVVQRPPKVSSTVVQKPRKPWRAQLNISVCRRSLQFDRMHEPQRL